MRLLSLAEPLSLSLRRACMFVHGGGVGGCMYVMYVMSCKQASTLSFGMWVGRKSTSFTL